MEVNERERGRGWTEGEAVVNAWGVGGASDPPPHAWILSIHVGCSEPVTHRR